MGPGLNQVQLQRPIKRLPWLVFFFMEPNHSNRNKRFSNEMIVTYYFLKNVDVFVD